MSRITDASLLRLAHQIIEHHPALARQLCEQGLASLENPAERLEWSEKLHEFIDNEPPEDDSETWLLSA